MGSTKKARPKVGDVLTGEPLPRDSHLVFIVARAHNGRDLPVRLHLHTTALDGAPKWSPAFANYLNDLIPVGVRREWQEWREWYTNEYIVERLVARFGQAMIDQVIEQVTGKLQDVRKGAAKRERQRRQVMRAIRSKQGLCPNHDRPVIGRHVFDLD